MSAAEWSGFLAEAERIFFLLKQELLFGSLWIPVFKANVHMCKCA